MTFEAVLFAGRWDRSTLSAYTNRLKLVKDNPKVSVILSTEMEGRRKGLLGKDQGWASVHDWELAVEWDTAEWELVSHELVPLAKTQFYSTEGVPRDRVQGLCVILRRKRGRKRGKLYAFFVSHFPSNIEGENGPNGPIRRVRANAEALTATGAYCEALRRRYPKIKVVVGADFNLNAHKVWVRKYLGGKLRLRGMWDEGLRRGGDHGRRLISLFFTRGLRQLGKARVLGMMSSSDHRPVKVRYFG